MMLLYAHKTQRNGVVKGMSSLENCRLVQGMKDLNFELTMEWSG